MNPITAPDAAETPPAEGTFTEPVHSVRTFETAIENILSGIERARLRAGDRLPNESELAEQLRISKPTLRQALRVLERSGLLTIKAGKSGGIFLASEFLPIEQIATNIEMEEEYVVELLRARRLIESAIAHEALLKADESDLDQIARTVELLKDARVGTTNLLRAGLMFHRAVALAAHNRVLEDTLRVIYRRLAPVRGTYEQSKEEAEVFLRAHGRQLEALRRRDPVQLTHALHEHFEYLEQRIATALGRPWAELFGDEPGAATRDGRNGH